MTTLSALYTATMAKLYADQGYWRKAADIYRHLVRQNPHRQDFKDALASAEAQIEGQSRPNWRELRLLVNEWISLQKEYSRRKGGEGKGVS